MEKSKPRWFRPQLQARYHAPLKLLAEIQHQQMREIVSNAIKVYLAAEFDYIKCSTEYPTDEREIAEKCLEIIQEKGN